jgi:hypothetical protein
MDPTDDPTASYGLSLAPAFYTPVDLQDEFLPSLVYAQSELAELSLFLDTSSIQEPPSSWDLEKFGYTYDAPLVHRDGRIEGAQQPPDYYAYSPAHLDTWEEGAEAIEDFDWTVPEEDLEYFETTQPVTAESPTTTEDDKITQRGNTIYHQNVATDEIVQTPLGQVEEHQPHMIQDLEEETLPLQKAASPPWISSSPTSRTIDPSPATATVPVDIEEIATGAEVEDNSALLKEAETVLDHPEPDAPSFPITSDDQVEEVKAVDSSSRTVTVTPNAAIFELSEPRAPTECAVAYQGDSVVNDSQPWDTHMQQAAANDIVDELDEDGPRNEQDNYTQGAPATHRPGAATCDTERSTKNIVHDTIEPMSNESIDDADDEDEVYETASDSTPAPALSPPNQPEVMKSEHSDIDMPEVQDDVSPLAELTSEALTTPTVIEEHAATARDHALEQVVTDARKRARSTKANASSDSKGEAPVKKKSKANGTKASTAANLKHVGYEVKHPKTESPIAQPSRLTATKSPKELTKKPSEWSLRQDKKESNVIEVKQKKKPVSPQVSQCLKLS